LLLAAFSAPELPADLQGVSADIKVLLEEVVGELVKPVSEFEDVAVKVENVLNTGAGLKDMNEEVAE